MITHEDKKEKNAKVKALKKNRKLMKENDIDHNDDDVHKKPSKFITKQKKKNINHEKDDEDQKYIKVSKNKKNEDEDDDNEEEVNKPKNKSISK